MVTWYTDHHQEDRYRIEGSELEVLDGCPVIKKMISLHERICQSEIYLQAL
jgi:hypothetical protein